MSQLGNTLGSTEALAGSGRNSRTLFVSSSVDDILDKLLFLGYSDTPLSRYYFQVADKNPNEQLFVFASLVTWLLRRLDVKDYEAPGQFDDPNVTCANIGSNFNSNQLMNSKSWAFLLITALSS